MARTTNRSKYLKEKYGICQAQWDRIYDKQGGKCPICGQKLRKPGNKDGKPASAVDHDHKTGRVRGIVDYYCNRRIIGRYRDTTRLKRLVEYLDSTFDGRDI